MKKRNGSYYHKTSKTYSNIRVAQEATENQPKPYIQYRRGCGMPCCFPWNVSGNEKLYRERLAEIFPEEKLHNYKSAKCCSDRDCQYYSKRKVSHCAIYSDAKNCDKTKVNENINKNVKLIIEDPKIVPTIKGLGMYDKGGENAKK